MRQLFLVNQLDFLIHSPFSRTIAGARCRWSAFTGDVIRSSVRDRRESPTVQDVRKIPRGSEWSRVSLASD